MSDPHHWGEFTQRPRATLAGGDSEFDDICARALTSAAGRELMAVLRTRYLEAHENPLVAVAALRVRATQQQFVRDLQAARDRGLAAAIRKAEAVQKLS